MKQTLIGFKKPDPDDKLMSIRRVMWAFALCDSSWLGGGCDLEFPTQFSVESE
jgi:hypothetical protein